jgi:activator of HSP90 ATPase
MSIHREATIPAAPGDVYDVLADAAALSALSGMTGVAGRQDGAPFVAFDQHVEGRQLELVPGERVVQAWRFPVWEPGVYSVVRFTLLPHDGGTRLVLDQEGVPADWHDHVHTNWPTFYLDPLRRHFSAVAVG